MKAWRAASLEQLVPIFIGKIPLCGIVGYCTMGIWSLTFRVLGEAFGQLPLFLCVFRGTELLSRFFFVMIKCNIRKSTNILYIATKRLSFSAGFSLTIQKVLHNFLIFKSCVQPYRTAVLTSTD
jgi:hypothetical protein